MATKVLLTPEAAADALSLSRSTVYLELAAGRLESIRVGRARRIPADAIEDWLRAKRTDAAESIPSTR
jgi:excisionase family DNA binding protein